MATTIPGLTPALCGLMPHAPVLVPAVAGPHMAQCRNSSEACAGLARRVVATEPERLFLVSPHAPRVRDAFGLCDGARLTGSLAEFGATGTTLDLPNDHAARSAIAEEASAAGLRTRDVPEALLDHGSLVPLWFLADAGWCGPTCVAALPWETTTGASAEFGAAVGHACARLGGTVTLIASGDMTHRALSGAPAGYDPRGPEFDARMTALVRAGRLRELTRIDPALRRRAAEDSVESSVIVCAALGFSGHGTRVLSYEHPFGVGYLVAIFHDGGG